MNETRLIPKHTLVVVADGTGAQLYRSSLQGGNVSLTPEGEVTPQNLESTGPSGSRPPEQTSQQTDEAKFAKQLAHDLYDRLNNDEYRTLVLMADPQTLGQMRDVMHQEVNKCVVRSIDKTLTNSPLEDIEAQLND